MKKILLLLAVAISSISCSNAQKKEFSKTTLESNVITSEGKKITFLDGFYAIKAIIKFKFFN